MRYGWTLEKHKWDNLIEAISGTHWSNTKLDQLYRDSVPKSKGVYVICVKTTNFNQRLFGDLYNVIYVGKVDKRTLHIRFLEHCNEPKIEIEMARQCFGDNLEYWFTIVELDQIDEIEARLIECFGPPANLKQESIPARTTESRPA